MTLKKEEHLYDIYELGDLSATAGSALPQGAKKATNKEMIAAIKTVQDPEIPVNLYDLGLIYKIDQKKNGDVHIQMTLTSPTCPIADQMPKMVAQALEGVEGVGKIEVKVVWDPPWEISMMSDTAKFALDLF